MLNSYICHILQFGIQHWWLLKFLDSIVGLNCKGTPVLGPLAPLHRSQI